MRPYPPIQEFLHSANDQPFYLVERYCIAKDNRQRDFVKHRTLYVRNAMGESMCVGHNDSRMRAVLRALLATSGHAPQWTGTESPALALTSRREQR